MGKLFETLLRDVGYPMRPVAEGTSEQVGERVKIWREQAKKQFPSLLSSINNALNTIAIFPNVSDINLDLNAVYQIGAEIKNCPQQEAVAFANFARGVVNNYIGKIDKLEKLTVASSNSIANTEILQLSGTLKDAHETFNNWADSISNVTSALVTLPLPREFNVVLQDVQQWASAAQTIEKSAVKIAENLFKETSIATTAIDGLAKQAETLKQQLTTTPQGQQYAVKAELRRVNKDLELQQTKLDATLQDLGQGIEAVGMFVGLAGNPRLAKQLVTAGQAGITIVKNISALVTGSLAAGPLGPLVAIGGAISALFGLFGGMGPDAVQIITDQINRLSEHMDKRFDRLEEIIQKSIEALAKHMDAHFAKVHEHMDLRFDRLEKMLGAYYDETIKNFRGIHAQQIATQKAIDHVQQKIDWLDKKIEDGLRILYSKDYMDTRKKVFDWEAIIREPLTDKELKEAVFQLFTWIEDGVKNTLMTGVINSSYSLDQIALNILAAGPDNSISLVMDFAEKQLGVKNVLQKPINPSAWAEAVRTLITLFERTANLSKLPLVKGVKERLDKVAKDGEEFNQFIIDLKSNPDVFLHLINNYRNSVKNVIKAAYDVLLTHHAGDPKSADTTELALKLLAGLQVAPEFIDREIKGLNLNYTPPPQYLAYQPIYDCLSKRTILREVLGKASCLFRDAHQRNSVMHNGGAVEEYTKAERGDYVASFYESALRHEVLKPYYDAIAGWSASSHAAAMYASNYNHLDNRLIALHTSAYLQGRILETLRGAAHHEKDLAAQQNRLPHTALMHKFFELVNRAELNGYLAGHDSKRSVPFAHLDACLKEMTTHYQLLSIFIAMAFPQEYTEDVNWRLLLQSLWTKDDFVSHICKDGSQDPNKFVISVMQNNLLAIVDDLEDRVLNKVYDLRNARQRQQPVMGHPLVNEVLQEIALFKQSLPDAEVQLQATPKSRWSFWSTQQLQPANVSNTAAVPQCTML